MSKDETNAAELLIAALSRLRSQGVTLAGEVEDQMLALLDTLAAAGLLNVDHGEETIGQR